jgi:uncharacterized protein (TIGR00645 family)
MLFRFERVLAALLYGSRWILAPCYFGLYGALIVILIEFFRELAHAFVGFPDLTGPEVILVALRLIDLLLVGNLVLIMSFAGVETLVDESVVEVIADRPAWIGKVDFGGLKLKAVASVVAIATVQLLETLMNIEGAEKSTLIWQVLILLSFALVGVLLAWMDRLTAER